LLFEEVVLVGGVFARAFSPAKRKEKIYVT